MAPLLHRAAIRRKKIETAWVKYNGLPITTYGRPLKNRMNIYMQIHLGLLQSVRAIVKSYLRLSGDGSQVYM